LTHEIQYLQIRIQQLQNQGVQQMSLSKQILDAITDESTIIDSFIALIQGMKKDETISAEAAQAILGAIAAEKTKVQDAIVANTPAANLAPTPAPVDSDLVAASSVADPASALAAPEVDTSADQ
jgi:Mg2+/Co2+ transporter CorC